MALSLDAFVVPLGGCIPWWPATVNAPAPTGWEFADGANVSTVGSPHFGRPKPRLMKTASSPVDAQPKKFPRGLDATAGAYGGATALIYGGNDTNSLAHTHTDAGSHSHGLGGHTHSMQSHTHGITTAAAHNHNDDGGGSGSSGPHSPGEWNNATPLGRIAAAGAHDHGGVTAVPSTPSTGTPSGGSDSAAFGTTNSQLSASTENKPPFVELCWIVRIL